MTEEVYYQLSNCEIMRLEVDDEHYYYGSQPGGEKEFYLSVTRVLDIAAPFPEGLRQYLRITSYEEQKERLEVTGNRGSKLHEALDRLMNGDTLDMGDYKTVYEKDAIVVFIRLMRFLTPSKFETELIVAYPAKRLAGTLDFEGWVDSWKLLALLNPNRYLETDAEGDFQLQERWINLPAESKRVHVIIDWKFTGRNAYSHKVQVSTYKTMFNKSRPGRVSRAFTWRYSPKHKFGYDFQESELSWRSFGRIYDTAIEYMQGFPEPPIIKRYPESVILWDKVKE